MILLVTLTVTDDASNMSVCLAVVEVEDSTNPIIICQPDTAHLGSDGMVTISEDDVISSSSDNCGIVGFAFSRQTFNCTHIGSNSVTITASDNSSNSGTCVSEVTVADTLSPNVSCIDITVGLDSLGNASIIPSQVDNGSTDNCLIDTYSLSQTDFVVTDLGPNNVILTVVDINGNSSNCTSIVTVTDSDPPVAICQAITVPLDASGAASIADIDIDGGSTDNGSIVNWSASQTAFDCSHLGNNAVVLTVMDDGGNDNSCSANVLVIDVIDPTVSCADVTISLDAAGEAAISASDVITASADNCGIVNESIDLDTFDCSNIGTSSVVVMVIDDSGNSSDCSADVTIQDNTSPVTLCQDIAINLDSLGNASIAAADIDFGTTDNCGLDSLTADITSFTNANLGLNTVLLTATDINGNVSTCTSIVTVQDGQAPNAICQNISVELDATGIASITPSDIDNGSTDNGVITDLSLDVSDFDCSNLGNNTVTLSVTDNGSNVSSCNAFVTVVDIDAPSVVCTDFIAQLNDLGEVVIDSADVVTSSDDNCGIIAYAFSQSIFGCGDITDHDVVVTVMDDSGNSANCTSVVTVQDTISPLANCMDISVGLDASGNASIIPLQLDNGSDDACGIDSYSLSQSNFTTADFGTNSVTLTVTDVNLNSSSCISNVTITDDIDPVAVCQDIQIDLDSISGTNSIIAADINNGSTDNGTIVSMIASQTSFSCTDVGVNSVTLTVTDESGNFSTCFAQVHVQENVLPSASCQDVIIVLDAISGEATITSSDIDNGSFDACGINSLVLSNTTFSPIGTYSTELTVEDFNGNSNSCNATVEVVDAIDPPIAVCHDIIVALDSNGEASITPQDIDGGSSDNVSIVNYTASQLDYSCANIGTSDILLTVEDTDGFEDNCIAEVTVEDNLAPNVTCQPLTLELDESGLATLIPMDAVLDYSDNCSVDITASQTGFNVNNLGSNDIVITATDGNANNTNCTSVVTVVDNIIPELVCNDLTIPLDENGQAAVTANTIGNGSSDNHILLFTSANLNLDCSDIGEMNYTLMAEDPSGNMSSCEAVISVVDNMAPLVQWNDFTVTLNDLNPIAVQLSEVSTGSTDNCSISDLVMDVNTFGINEIGQNVVTITATDLSGNEGTCQSMVTVESTLAPKAICQDVTVSLDQNGLVVVLASEVDNGSSDAIAINNMVLSQSSFDCSNVGDNTVQLTVTNTIGISTDCSAIITVEDDLAPVVVCPDDKEFVNDLGQCGAIVVYDDFTVTDNCSVFVETLIQGQPSGTFFEIGVTTIELRYSDEKANETSCVFDVIVIDAELPTISCPDDIVTEEAVVIYDVPVFNDNCSADLNQIDGLVSGSTFAHGNNAIEFVATDLEGNIAECSFNILVNQDAIANNDSINASMNNDGVDINPLVNDFDPDGDEISITNADASIGHVVIENGTNLVYTPLSDWCGTDSIQYEISDEFNGRTTATIYIEVDCEVVLFFPEGISPNGDGINDYFEIVGIEDYPEAELNIYNRWGRIVYQTIGYDNSWNGTISNNFTLGRKILPQGTYFYNLKVDEETPVVKGYFYISLEKE